MGDREVEVVNNESASQFEAEVHGHRGTAEYRQGDGRIEFTHTQVPQSLKGQGIGSALARAGLEYARTEGLEVVPTCRFIASYIDRHPEYKDLVAGS